MDKDSVQINWTEVPITFNGIGKIILFILIAAMFLGFGELAGRTIFRMLTGASC